MEALMIFQVLYLVFKLSSAGTSICTKVCGDCTVRLGYTLDCKNHGLSTLPDQIPDYVEELDLSYNLFNAIPKTSLPKALSSLNLSYNKKLTLISYEGLTPNYLVETVDLRSCSIQEIDNTIFRIFPNLITLNLAQNPITKIIPLLSRSLNTLNLIHCNIRLLHMNTFQYLEKLTNLWISHNEDLRRFPCDSRSLSNLNISYCNLEHVPTGSLPNVTQLDLRGNNIKTVEENELRRILNLEILILANNSIIHIDNNSLNRSVRLVSIDLSYNRLSTIDKNIFRYNIDLIEVDLSHNYFTKLESFNSNSLKVLKVSHCEIEYLHMSNLASVRSLQKLNLERNRISYLPDNLEGPNLTDLDLSHNDIRRFNNRTFASLISLKTLILTGNKLTTIDPNNIPQIVNLEIYDNPWECDCDDLFHIYNRLQNSGLKCQSPAKFEGFSWEQACSTEWNKNESPHINMWWYGLTFTFAILIMVLLVCIAKRIEKFKKLRIREEEAENEVTQELARTQQNSERQNRIERIYLTDEEDRNAPDPRELQPPPYSEAVMLPRLDLSHPSLAGSIQSISSFRASNPDVSKRRRRKRSRRRRRSTCSQLSDMAIQTDVSDNERPSASKPLEESSL